MRGVRRSKSRKSHRVQLCRYARPHDRKGKGRSVALFAFSYRDVAELLGVSVKHVQRLSKRRAFDILDLGNILDYVNARRAKIPSTENAAAGDPMAPPSGEFN